MRSYDEYLRKGRLQHGRRFDDSGLSKQFVPYFENRERITVAFYFQDKVTEIRRGIVSATTGWKPSFLLMATARSTGSPYLLGDEDKIVTIDDWRKWRKEQTTAQAERCTHCGCKLTGPGKTLGCEDCEGEFCSYDCQQHHEDENNHGHANLANDPNSPKNENAAKPPFWVPWQLAPDSDPEERFILVNANDLKPGVKKYDEEHPAQLKFSSATEACNFLKNNPQYDAPSCGAVYICTRATAHDSNHEAWSKPGQMIDNKLLHEWPNTAPQSETQTDLVHATKLVQPLRDAGYAVILWTPEELKNADPTRVEDRSIELGWEVINDLQ